MWFFAPRLWRRFTREPLRIGLIIAGGLSALLVLVAMFEPYNNPLSIELLKQDCDSNLSPCRDGAIVTTNQPSSMNDPLDFFVEGAWNGTQIELAHKTRRPTCNISHPKTDICEMEGDVRIHGKFPTVDFYLTDFDNGGGCSWHIKPYARKDYTNAMSHVREVRVREVDRHHLACQVNHTIPAVVFSTGGYLGNIYHDLSDVVLPLFLTTHQFSGNIQFLVTDYKEWWIRRYKEVVSHLTNYSVLDLDSDDRVHCFPRATVGLTRHAEFSIDPSLSPHGLTTTNFTAFLRSALSLPRSVATHPSPSGNRPRLLLISRKRTRRIVNVPEVASVARQVGFDVAVKEGTDAGVFASIVNSCDVMVGVHGAGMANMVFLPERAVVVQIVPLGGLAEWAGWLRYGKPAGEMKLRHLQYKIEVDESTLVDLYPRNHTVLTNPWVYVKKDLNAFGEIYFKKQDVRINAKRFQGVLEQALELLRQ